MTSSGSIRGNLTWAGALAAGAWLSMKVARWVVDAAEANGRADASREPVREIVQEVLDEHRSDDTPMVHAFETALEAGGAGERA